MDKITELNQEIQKNPNDVKLYYSRGVAFAAEGNFEKAISDFSRVIEIIPNDSIYCNRGMMYFNIKEYEKAIADFTKVIEIAPKDYEAFYFRGEARKLRKEYDLAILDYNESISINPNYSKAYLSRGVVYGVKKDDYKGVIDFEAALRLGLDTQGIETVKSLTVSSYNRQQAMKNLGGDYLTPKFLEIVERINILLEKN